MFRLALIIPSGAMLGLVRGIGIARAFGFGRARRGMLQAAFPQGSANV